MNITGISNVTFKGAYIISGNGADVKETEDKLKNRLGKDAEFNKLGNGYVASDTPAYILVTTGEDTHKYNKYVSKHQQYCDDIEKQTPEEYAEKDFDTKYDYIRYRIKRAGNIAIKSVKENCGFEKEPVVFDAKEVLNAVIKNKFDGINGKINIE